MGNRSAISLLICTRKGRPHPDPGRGKEMRASPTGKGKDVSMVQRSGTSRPTA